MTIATEPRVRYSHAIGRLTQSGPGFNNPVDVALGDGGRLYVLNRSNMSHAEMGVVHVTICTVDEEYLGDFGTFGSGDGQMIWPASLAADRAGNVYLSDERRHDVQMFDRDGSFLRKWGGQGSGPGQLNRPSGLAVDPAGNVLVVDALNSRVQTWSPAGEHLAVWGSAGSGPGQFNLPWGITVDREGAVYVADWRNSRVQKLTSEGQHLATFGGPGDHAGSLDRPAGVAVDSVGNVYVTDYGRDRLEVYGPDGSHLQTLLGDATMSTWAEPYIAADPEMTMLRAQYADDVAAQERVFEGPMGIEIDERDRIVIADCCKHRVQVYQRA